MQNIALTDVTIDHSVYGEPIESIATEIGSGKRVIVFGGGFTLKGDSSHVIKVDEPGEVHADPYNEDWD